MAALAHLLGVVRELVRLPPRIHGALLRFPSALRGLPGALQPYVDRAHAAASGVNYRSADLRPAGASARH